MINFRKFSVLSYVFIVVFWLLVLGFFLYSPIVTQWFYKERSLTIFTWPLILDPQYLKKFEKETGIKLYISYYESNQELFSKVQATSGSGYDIIMPSDSTVELLVKDKLLKKIDRSKLTFYDQLNKHLLGNYFDPNNEYSLPYFWGVYGLGINRKYFGGKLPPATWALLFQQNVMPFKIGMTDESREAILLAAFYLFGTIDIANDPEKLAQVKQLLIKQKQWVEAYSESRSEYLLASQSVPVAMALSPDIYKVKDDYPYLDFVIPQEGSFIFIDSIVIPATTTKDDMIYTFINYLYRPEVLDYHRQKFGFCSPVQEKVPQMPENFCPSAAQFSRLHFFKNVIPQEIVNDIWMNVMSK